MWNSESSDSELEFNTGKKGKKSSKSKSKGKKAASSSSAKNEITPQDVINKAILAEALRKSKEEGSGENKMEENDNNGRATRRNARTPPEIITSSQPSVSDENFGNDEESLGDSSSDESGGMGMGKQALGIDPGEIGNYDGTTMPQNGSQYLLKVMQEKRRTPNVKVADINQISSKLKENLRVNYLDKFVKEVSPSSLAADSQQSKPTKEWREKKVYEFSLLRSKIERWRELLSQGVTKLKTDKIKLPTLGNKVVWQRFCLGLKFEDLAEVRRVSTENNKIEVILQDYFLDLKTFKSGSLIKSEKLPNDCPLSPGSITTTDNTENATSPSTTTTTTTTSSDVSCIATNSIDTGGGSEGNQPLMSILLMLSQQQIMQLIYYQSDWINRHGFINKCQGEWLYALLACIDKPLEPSTMGDIRNICKRLIAVREKFCNLLKEIPEPPADVNECEDDIDALSDDFKKDVSIDKETEENSDDEKEEYLNSVHLFIYLIADYFCQKDLVSKLD